MYEIILTRKAQRFYEQAQPSLVKRLNNCLDSLSKDPFANPSSKPLRGALSGYYRCRVGDWRVVFAINELKKEITIVLIAHRRDVYR
jgi:mRNA interferase RelE/StbE